MRAVPLVPQVPEPRSRSRTALTVVAWLLAILFHILLLLTLWWSLRHHHAPKVPPPITVQLVPPPKPAVNRPKPKPVPKLAVKPKPKPKAPPPAPPKPKPLPPPPHLRAPPKLVPLPPKVQFQRGKLGKTSHAGQTAHHAPHPKVVKRSAPKLPYWLNGSIPLPPPHHGAMTMGSRGAPGKHLREATQSERDIILSQILEGWHRPYFPGGSRTVIDMRVVVLPNGYLAAPFDARGKWDPAHAIHDFRHMASNDPRRDLLLSLYMAIRVAQPLTLPPRLKAKAPFLADLDFRLSDVP